MAALKLRKKLQKVGSSKAVIIPNVWIQHWKNEAGKEPEFVEIVIDNGDLRITPIFDSEE